MTKKSQAITKLEKSIFQTVKMAGPKKYTAGMSLLEKNTVGCLGLDGKDECK